MTRLFIILALLTGIGCTADQADPVDPTGVWAATITWSPIGECGTFPVALTYTSTTVSRVGNRYLIDEHGQFLTGQVACSPGSCNLSFTETGSPGGAITSFTLSVNLTVDSSDEISGAGAVMMTLSDGRTCRHTFSAAGTLRRDRGP